MIGQTIAIFLDAYRELNARKLFWITLAISGLFVGVMAALGKDDLGLSILWFHVDLPVFMRAVTPATFYKLLFLSMGVGIWLTWAATILALISTAGIIPEFISGGSIELALSKPISRLRLFLTKYLTGLLFVALQVAVFSLGSFLVIGVRGGEWMPRLFWAVPLVVLFFSYLYAFCVLIGMLTRSTIASLLLTILIWLMIFLVHIAETGIVLQFRVMYDQAVILDDARLEERKSELDAIRKERIDAEAAAAGTGDTAPVAKLDERIRSLEQVHQQREELRHSDENTRKKLHFAHSILFATKTVMPKTSETIELLKRSLMSKAEEDSLIPDQPDQEFGFGDRPRDVRVPQRTIQREMQRILRERSVFWVAGTSVLCELVVLSFAAFVFCRRDF